MSVILNRRVAATVIAGLRLLAGDGVRVPHYPYTLVAGLCDETDPEYELRFDAHEEYIRELINRIDEMSLRGSYRRGHRPYTPGNLDHGCSWTYRLLRNMTPSGRGRDLESVTRSQM